MAEAAPIQVGDLIRVRDWPGTRGRRFRVTEITRGTIWATDDRHAFRAFDARHCIRDDKATAAARARREAREAAR